jgi:hypothetical protein
MHVDFQNILMFDHFTYAALRVVCPTVNTPVVNPISGETSVKYTHTCFPSTHPYTRTLAELKVDLHSIGKVKKFTCVSFFVDIPSQIANIESKFEYISLIYFKSQIIF